jgi:hypothetical protein
MRRLVVEISGNWGMHRCDVCLWSFYWHISMPFSTTVYFRRRATNETVDPVRVTHWRKKYNSSLIQWALNFKVIHFFRGTEKENLALLLKDRWDFRITIGHRQSCCKTLDFFHSSTMKSIVWPSALSTLSQIYQPGSDRSTAETGSAQFWIYSDRFRSKHIYSELVLLSLASIPRSDTFANAWHGDFESHLNSIESMASSHDDRQVERRIIAEWSLSTEFRHDRFTKFVAEVTYYLEFMGRIVLL